VKVYSQRGSSDPLRPRVSHTRASIILMAIIPIKGGRTKEQAKDALFTDEDDIKGYEDTVQPVVEVNVRTVNVWRHTTVSATGQTVIFTTPTDKDFYLTGSYLAFQKDDLNDMLDITIDAFMEDGHISFINRLFQLAATESVGNSDIPLTFAVKLKRGTPITLNHIFGAGTGLFMGIIYGYTEDTQRKATQ